MALKKEALLLTFILILFLLFHRHVITAEENLQSVVMIENFENSSDDFITLKSGTGFVVSANTKEHKILILTNFHVCSSPKETFLTYTKYTDTEHYAANSFLDRPLKIIKADPSNDLCLLESENDYLPPVEFEKHINIMDDIYIIGAPQSFYPLWIDGKVSAFIEKENKDKLLVLSANILKGHSGSPVFNQDGKVVGIVFASLGKDIKYGGQAIPSATILNFLKN